MDLMSQARVIKKVAWRIVPLMALLYAINFVDRVNVGFAALTMNKSLGLTAAEYGFGSGVFFFGYFLFQIPSNLMLNRVGAHVWIPFLMITWGVISGAMAFIRGANDFYWVRFLLGAAEAGFYPGVVLYLQYWFPPRKVAQMNALFGCGGTLGVVIASPISGALLGRKGFFGMESWRSMFVLEALPAVLLGSAAFFLLTSRPEQASWLSGEERSWLSQATRPAEAANSGVPGESIWRGIFDLRVLMISVIYFGAAAALIVAGVWAPLMIQQLGFSPLQIGFLNSAPTLIALVGGILYAWHSDHTGERIWHVVIACLIGAAGFVLGGFISTTISVIIAFAFISFGASAPKPPLWGLTAIFLSGRAKAAGIATINAVGNLGGFCGPYIIGVVKNTTGSFRGGLYCVAGFLVLSACLMLVMVRVRPIRPPVRLEESS